MLEQINSALPTVAAVVFLLSIVLLMARFYARLPELIEEPTGRHKLSSKRFGALAVTAATFLLMANGHEVSLEVWMFNAWLWGAKTLQRRFENGNGS